MIRALQCYFLLMCANCYTQTHDSLYHKLIKLPPNDTVTINARNDYIKQALFSNPADTTLFQFTEETLKLANKLSYKKGILLAYERMGLLQQYSFSNPFKALEFYHKALGIIENNRSLNVFKGGVLGNIAIIYYEQEEYQKALTIFNDILHTSKTTELRSLANIANIYGSLQKQDSAIYYYKKALNHPQLEGNVMYEANLWSNMSLMYQQSNNLKEAKRAIEKSLQLIDAHKIEFVRPTAYTNAAMVYLANKEYDQAKKYALEALQFSQDLGNLFMQKSAWGTLADVYEAEKDYLKSLDAYKKYAVFKDSLNNQNRRVEINRQQMQFDFEKKEALGKMELNRQSTIKRATVIGASGFVLISFIGFIMYKRRRDAVGKQKEAEFNALVSETELKALRAQMNPHFIFNSLNSIGDYILKHDKDKAQEYLIQFAQLMRMVLENSEQEQVLLSEELKFMELYLQVESKRLPNRFTYSIILMDNLDSENILVPPLLLQPFIENSIWHGFNTENTKGHILITIKKEKDMLLCSVDDNGTGRNLNSTRKDQNKSFGIAITENRLKILNQRKLKKGKLCIIEKPNHSGTYIEISLPLEFCF
ncbi:tetratricopeptide repeat-containing sensor histidine kinase [Confluentibacter sediminis]|uniref:tetratricopeptide repeat-containing sensor histidine kinase n=1 Tax=Confluentibacter sediminis TaxID=2219045 RepID=UPI000DAB9DCA|nr:histidine kinase [Confluentibacter sediminis]